MTQVGTEPVSINPAYTFQRVCLRWRAANGPLPALLAAEGGEAASILPAANGDLILKRGMLDAAGVKALVEAILAGALTADDVLTPEEAAAAVAPLGAEE